VTRRIALLANPAAGRGRAHHVLDDVVARLGADGTAVDLISGDDAAASLERARRAVEDGVDTLVVLGGDGMVHLAVQALAESPTALGVIPLGTGNDFARAMGIPHASPLEAADLVRSGQRRRIDLARAGDVWYATILAAGFEALVTARGNAMTLPIGSLRYTAAVALELPRFTPLHYTFEIDGVTESREAMLVSLANTSYYGGGMHITPSAVPDDGYLDLVVVEPIGRLELLRFFPTVRTGKHVEHPAYTTRRVRSITIAAADVTAYADGERFGDLPLTITCVPGALDVLC
jgi:diacylglycerol kinase (ATP)